MESFLLVILVETMLKIFNDDKFMSNGAVSSNDFG